MNLKPYKLSVLAVSLISPAALIHTTAEVETMPAAASSPVARMSAERGDCVSIDSTIAAIYDVISGEAGEERDWDRMRSLFHPSARLISVSKNAEGEFTARSLTPDEYIVNASPFFAKEAFFERELSRKVEKFGHIAHVFSTYEAVQTPDGEPIDRGINSMQLFYDENRWWVMTIYWDRETEEHPLPEQYLE